MTAIENKIIELAVAHREALKEIDTLQKQVEILTEAVEAISELKTVYSNQQPVVWYVESVVKASQALQKIKEMKDECS